MITKEKLEVYDKFEGLDDGLLHMGTEEEKKLFDEDDWSIIDGFIQDIIIVENGLASESYAEDLQKNLREHCNSKEVIEQLIEIANKIKSQ